MNGPEFDRWLGQVLRTSAPPPSRALLERVLAVPNRVAVESGFDFFALFSGWQKALAGGAVCASLLAGLVLGGGQSASVDDTLWESDIPGLTYSPGDVGEWQ